MIKTFKIIIYSIAASSGQDEYLRDWRPKSAQWWESRLGQT